MFGLVLVMIWIYGARWREMSEGTAIASGSFQKFENFIHLAEYPNPVVSKNLIRE